MRSVPLICPAGVGHRPEQRRDAGVQLLARCGRRHAACGAVQQPRTQPRFELADGLAQRGRRHTEVLGGPRKAAALDHGGKGFQFGVVGAAHCVLIAKQPVQILGDSLIFPALAS
jgi:hypothetical protein